jgi:hypothetical protein
MAPPSTARSIRPSSNQVSFTNSLRECISVSLESMSPEVGSVVREVQRQADSSVPLTTLSRRLRDQAENLAMGLDSCLNWAQRMTECRAAADVLDGWTMLTGADPALAAPHSGEALEHTAAVFHRFIQARWRPALVRARREVLGGPKSQAA